MFYVCRFFFFLRISDKLKSKFYDYILTDLGEIQTKIREIQAKK
jgi:hypothetical protein